MADAPKAPWSPFPLTELIVLLAMALIVGGVLTDGGRRGALLGCGFALVSLAGLELAIREHFTGYRSHSVLLALACAMFAAALLYALAAVIFGAVIPLIPVAVGVVVFVPALIALRNAFKRASGGLSFRIGPLRG